MLILAHRGHHTDQPENTLPAFEAALNLGADGIETDVRTTRDGVPVLFHDRLLQGREVGGLTHTELCQLAGYEVPTLVSALDAWPDIFWNLELKQPTDLAPVWPILQEYGSRRRLLVSSFWHPAAIHAGRALGLRCGLLVAHRPLRCKSLLEGVPQDLPRNRLVLVWEYASLDQETIEAAHAAGVASFVYGPQTLIDLAHLAWWNVAGVITDHVRDAVGHLSSRQDHEQIN